MEAQKRNVSFLQADFAAIDRRAQWIDAETPSELANKLTEPYEFELEKVCSIFSWITSHITYDIRDRRPSKRFSEPSYDADADTGSLKPLNERVAINVLKRRETVCNGYARLFQNLCEHAGLQAQVVHGYAKGSGRSTQFTTNHAWNAVSIDSNWYLFDVTWAAGYFTYQTNEYVRSRNERYFMADPQSFIDDHYPEDLRWTLLNEPPRLREFQKSPFKYAGYARRQIVSHFPAQGTLEVALGDSLTIELLSSENEKNLYVTDNAFVDTATLSTATWQAVINNASKIKDNKASFTYTVSSPDVEWLNVIFNNEIVLRYRLQVILPPPQGTAAR